MTLDDQAEAAEQRYRDAALAMRKPILLARGRCHYCEERVHAGELFCRPDVGASCRDDFEALKAAQHRNGV